MTTPSVQKTPSLSGFWSLADPFSDALASVAKASSSRHGICTTFGSRSHGDVDKMEDIIRRKASKFELIKPTDEAYVVSPGIYDQRFGGNMQVLIGCYAYHVGNISVGELVVSWLDRENPTKSGRYPYRATLKNRSISSHVVPNNAYRYLFQLPQDYHLRPITLLHLKGLSINLWGILETTHLQMSLHMRDSDSQDSSLSQSSCFSSLQTLIRSKHFRLSQAQSDSREEFVANLSAWVTI